MNVKQKRRYDMFTRVDRFGIEHARAFPRGSIGRQLFATLREPLARLPNEFAAQALGLNRAREGTADKAAARTSLYAALGAINRTARALAIDRPGLRGKFRLPSRESDEALVAAARAFAGNAQRWAPIFIAYGLRTGFVEELRAVVARFEHAIAYRAEGRRAHVTARAAIDARLADLFVIVRRLDAVVVNVLGEDAAALEMWRRARKIARRRASKDRPRRGMKARLTVIQPHHAEMGGVPQ
jgi:hypothetical protein